MGKQEKEKSKAGQEEEEERVSGGKMRENDMSMRKGEMRKRETTNKIIFFLVAFQS